jgi:hypothetical protein
MLPKLIIELQAIKTKLICGQYYKHMTIVNDDSSIVNKLEALLTDDARGVIYDRRMFCSTGHLFK